MLGCGVFVGGFGCLLIGVVAVVVLRISVVVRLCGCLLWLLLVVCLLWWLA